MKRVSVSAVFLLCFGLFLLFLCFPEVVRVSAEESVLFCGKVLIPSLFPGFVFADLLINLSGNGGGKSPVFERVFRLPGAMKRCFWIGLLAGFPSAADCAVRQVQRGEVEKEDAERCLAFTNNPGIVFVVFAVGVGIFGSLRIGFYLWVLQTVSSVLIGVLFANQNPACLRVSALDNREISLKRLLPNAVVSSVSAVLNVCGFVVFFRVLITILTFSLPLRPLQAFLAGVLEMTCGVSNFNGFDFLTAILISAILGWSGFSVHFQIMSRVASADLSLKYYFPGKVLQSALSAVLTFGTYPLFFFTERKSPVLSLIVLITSVILLLSLRLRKEILWKTKTSARNGNG